ncbi:MAG TPA: hypothetical protein VGD33_06615 [Chitinophagaceae bacterium]
MNHFNETLKTSNGILNFYFNRKSDAIGSPFLISTVQRDGTALVFEMEKAGDQWFLTKNNTTDFLIVIESRLSAVIKAHTGS